MKKFTQSVFSALALFVLLATTGVASAASVNYVWTEKDGGTSTGTLTLSAAGILSPPSSWGPLAATVDSLIFNGTDYTLGVTAANGISSDGSGLTAGNITFAPSSIAFVIAAETDQVTIVSGGSTNYMGDWTVAPVPVPAAVWLFGSGLLCLVGFARKKKAV